MAKYMIGDEFSEGWGNYIVIDIERVAGWDEGENFADRTHSTRRVEYVTTFDYEGIVDRQPASVWTEYVEEMNLQPVTEPNVVERVREWAENFPEFPVWAECAWGIPTGRMFIYDDYNACLVKSVPDHDEWHVWTEYRDEDGAFWYVSDHEGYTLDAEEFGPIDEGMDLTVLELKDMRVLDSEGGLE